MSEFLSRRQWLSSAAVVSAAAGLTSQVGNVAAQDPNRAPAKAVTKGNIKQSVVFWCFNAMGDKWDIDTTCKHAKALGCVSVELGSTDNWPTIKKNGLVCAIASNNMPGAPFMRGFNNPAYHDEVIARTTEVIDKCAEFGFPSVIAFTGFKYRKAEDPQSGEISLDEGFDNCVKGFKKIIGHAEKKKVNICLEHLNSRDGSHPMKGHPGYQGDDVDYCAKIIRAVGSERMKLLFDIYHVQIMNGDVIRRIDELKDVIGHVHTAGNPGRGELDDNQEINYPPIMRKLIEVGYQGYVGQEFIPTRDPLTSLTQAVKLCDV
ncbi:TIM barrel protein [Anatilimnocola floriformis]|uniref:TIM barrel protein n=1 Tax=Anatilimnocola floriformis TaxID=2948575 RepID=UPI0020C5A8DB|nr:TIM barrel protein [Anatilimnocola floriformis]